MIDSRRKHVIEVLFFWDGGYSTRRYPVPNREAALAWAEKKLEFELPEADSVQVREWVKGRDGRKVLVSSLVLYRHIGVWQKSV